ncbi:hypothetical protein H0E84_09740 [Luteimonas sp. SJ-92]|uniref:Uncharacterized protein n=1 Tax=Luteimonas salinisoli TaxID=2752307 RepID=A0A853JDI2_9GAMM|nr:hypothetical protein [Luteimonas salinisoli]NZA26667.1 hypothetical protein [Luteimonas salinisoli]
MIPTTAVHAILFALALTLGAGPAGAEETMAATVGELPGPGPYQRFIVKYRSDSAPGRDPRAVQSRLDRAVAASGLMLSDEDTPLALQWQRRLAVQADVLQAERPLDRAEARRLLEALAADPDVEYVEVDALMRAGPGPMQRPD